MYEHPYLAAQITEYEQEQLRQAVERRRFLIEHADQLVARRPGPVRRMLARLRALISAPRTDAVAAAGSRSKAAGDPAPAR